MVIVVKAIVLNVVAQGGNEQRHGIDMVELGVFWHVLGLQDDVAVLSDVGTMKVVVIVHALIILVVDLGEELHELWLVDVLHQVILFHYWRCQNLHLDASADCVWELENIKLEWVDTFVEIIMLDNKCFHWFGGQLEVNVVLEFMLIGLVVL